MKQIFHAQRRERMNTLAEVTNCVKFQVPIPSCWGKSSSAKSFHLFLSTSSIQPKSLQIFVTGFTTRFKTNSGKYKLNFRNNGDFFSSKVSEERVFHLEKHDHDSLNQNLLKTAQSFSSLNMCRHGQGIFRVFGNGLGAALLFF